MKKALSLLLMLSILLALLTSCATSQLPELEEEETTEEKAPVVTKTEEDKPEQVDPSSDSVLNIIIIGNSFSTGFPDEMYGLFESVGIKADIYSVYYSGCTLAMHWNWLQQGHSDYRFNHHLGSNGKRESTENMSLVKCLSKKNWDVISIQHDFTPATKPGFELETFVERSGRLADRLFQYLKEEFPKSRLYWHEEWAYDVGWSSSSGGSIPTVEKQAEMYHAIQSTSMRVLSQNDVGVVPSGYSWQVARSMGIENITRDGYHDGPNAEGIGPGGQYLNACTWFESLTGLSCIGNKWRPKYDLPEEKLLKIQEAAHKAVAEYPKPEAKA